MSKERKFIISRLKKQKGRCAYCSIKLDPNKIAFNGVQTDDMATVEHIYSKLDIRRYLSEKKVVTCYKCNNDKYSVDQAKIFSDYKNMYADYHKDLKELPDYHENLLFNLLNNKPIYE